MNISYYSVIRIDVRTLM